MIQGMMESLRPERCRLRSPLTVEECAARLERAMDGGDLWEFASGRNIVYGDLRDGTIRLGKVQLALGQFRRRFPLPLPGLRGRFEACEDGCVIHCSNHKMIFVRSWLVLQIAIGLALAGACWYGLGMEPAAFGEGWTTGWSCVPVALVYGFLTVWLLSLRPVARSRGEWEFLLRWLVAHCEAKPQRSGGDSWR